MQLNQYLIYPMAIYVFFMFGLIFYSLRSRIRSVKSKEIDGQYFRTYSDKSLITEDLLLIERQVDNQFQLPVLFIASCGVVIAMNQVQVLTIVLAWVFVFSRFWHTYEHLGKNRVLKRASIYGLGWFVVLAVWSQMVLKSITN